MAVLAGHCHEGGYFIDDFGIHHVTVESPLEAAVGEGAWGVVQIYADRFVSLSLSPDSAFERACECWSVLLCLTRFNGFCIAGTSRGSITRIESLLSVFPPPVLAGTGAARACAALVTNITSWLLASNLFCCLRVGAVNSRVKAC